MIYDVVGGRHLEEIEANMAFYEVYDGAIYMYQGKPYYCISLNLDTKVALVRPADVKWYTKVKEGAGEERRTGGGGFQRWTGRGGYSVIGSFNGSIWGEDGGRK